MENKEAVLKKLGLTERGATFILNNSELCERILKDTPIDIVEYSEKTGLSKTFILNMIRDEKISSFRNTPNQGSKTYVFKEELDRIGDTIYTNREFYFSMLNETKSFIERLINLLTERDQKIYRLIFIEGKTLSHVAKETKLSEAYLKSNLWRTLFRIREYIKKRDSFEALQKKYIELTVEYEAMKKDFDLVNTKEPKPKYNAYLFKSIEHDLVNELSIRTYNILRTAKINYVFELVQMDINDLLKFRNFGKLSANELEELLRKNKLHFKMTFSKNQLFQFKKITQ